MVRVIGNASVLKEILAPSLYEASATELPVLELESGAMACYQQATVLQLLESTYGVTPRRFKAMLGYSGGASVGLGYVANRVQKVFELFEHMGDRFFSPSRLSELGTDLIQLKYLMKCTKEHISKSEIKNLPIPVFVNVTKQGSGRGIFIDARSAKDPYKLIMASQSLPVFSSPVNLEQGMCVDGSCGFDFSSVIKELRPRKLLIIASRPMPSEQLLSIQDGISGFMNALEYNAFPYVVRGVMGLLRHPQPLCEVTARMDVMRMEMFNRIPKLKKIKVCVIVPEQNEAIAPYEWSPKTMRSKSALYRKNLQTLFEKIKTGDVH